MLWPGPGTPLGKAPGSQAVTEVAGRSRLAVAGLFALAMIPLLATPVLPLIDFYNHLARFFVLAHVAQDPFLAG